MMDSGQTEFQLNASQKTIKRRKISLWRLAGYACLILAALIIFISLALMISSSSRMRWQFLNTRSNFSR